VRRLAGEGEFAVPGEGLVPLQVIDVRDLAGWILRLMEQRATGAFHAVGPRDPLTFCGLVTTGLAALASKARPVWVPEDQLESGDGAMAFPLWVSGGTMGGIFAIDGSKAFAAGLTLRPLAESIVDVSRYEAAQAKPVLTGPTAEVERALLDRMTAGSA